MAVETTIDISFDPSGANPFARSIGEGGIVLAESNFQFFVQHIELIIKVRPDIFRFQRIHIRQFKTHPILYDRVYQRLKRLMEANPSDVALILPLIHGDETRRSEVRLLCDKIGDTQPLWYSKHKMYQELFDFVDPKHSIFMEDSAKEITRKIKATWLPPAKPE